MAYQQQELNIKQVQRVISNYKKDGEARHNLIYFQSRLERLESSWAKCEQNHFATVQELAEMEKEAKCYGEQYEKLEEIVFSYLVVFKQKIDELKESSTSTGAPATSEVPESLKLERIRIPTFSGSYTKWLAFRDLFRSMVHENAHLTAVQKLQYLRNSVRDEAEQLINHLSISEANYEPAWELLCERYDNHRLISQEMMQRFWNIKCSQENESSGLRLMLDTVNQLLASMKTLEANSFDLLVVFILNQKLDEESQKEWQKHISDTKAIPTLGQFLDFLKQRFAMLEALSPTKLKLKSSRQQVRVNTVQVETKSMNCLFCKMSHKLFECQMFKQASVIERRDFVNTNKLCFNCLSPKHRAVQCPTKRGCKMCAKKHNTLLHMDMTEIHKSPTHVMHSHYTVANKQKHVLLATALVQIQLANNDHVILRALLDTGSQRSFITESAMQLLNTDRHKETMRISGIGALSNIKTRGITTIEIDVRDDDGKVSKLAVEALILRTITSPLPSTCVSVNLPAGLKTKDLADPNYHTPSNIDLLLGADVYAKILLPGLLSGNPCAQRTKLGWILFGITSQAVVNPNYRALVSYQQLEESLQKFWETEELTSCTNWSDSEVRAENEYSLNTYRRMDGRYVVSLPFQKDSIPESDLGDSLRTAYKRFHQLERRLTQNGKLYDEYRKFMKEYIELGHMTRVSIHRSKPEVVYYLPHHEVVKEDSSTTKLRVVFNASQKTSNGKTLNDLLLTGPSIQENILHILMRWRQHRYVMTADIAKMYRQIWVNSADRNFQRILWRSNQSEPIQHYQLNTVTYGTACAPFLAIRTLHQLAEDEKKDFPEGSKAMMTDFYVDDLLTGSDSLEELVNRQTELRLLLKKGGFHLRKWSSNNPKLLEHIPPEDRETQIPFNIAVQENIKTLGLQWHPASDDFSIIVNQPEEQTTNTKRSILAEISKLFDPIGFLQPCIIIGKVTLQKLWLIKCDWDDPLDKDIISDWLTLRKQLPILSNLRIPRWIHYAPSTQIELHGFCDASQKAYAAAIYLRIITPSSVTVTLLTAKSKVAPIKTQSIPRLELCGAVLLVKLMKEVVTAHKWSYVSRFFWTDSTIVLAWLQSPASRWKIYVANRVSMIQQETSSENWNHVSSECNPADIATRGMLPKDIQTSDLWWHGPSWLSGRILQLSKPKVSHEGLEETINGLMATDVHEPEIFSRYSSFTKLQRVVAYCLRFINNCRNKHQKRLGSLSLAELELAHNSCIKMSQRYSFGEDIEQLRSKGAVSKNSNIRSLTPWIDSEGILRVGGRIHNALIGRERKHPALLKRDTLARLLIHQAHLQTLHGGVQLTMATLRLRYWILSSQSLVRSILRKCLTCFKMSAKPQSQMMGILPAVRVRFEKPFLQTGIDYAGPITIKWNGGRGAKTTKAYVVVFVCMATKAFHLEVASDLTTQTCVAAIRRFISRRGKCTTIHSDCGSNFIGASKQLKPVEVFRASSSQLAHEGIEWKFIPPGSPHFGGLWEAGVKSMKRHLYKTVGQQLLNIEEFVTLLTQIEACLNSRPLTQISDDTSDCAVLTPGHFLTGENLFEIKSDPSEVSQTLLKRWKLVQQMKHSFWQRWSQEYLHRLQQRPKWLKENENPKDGELVLVKIDHFPSMNWPLARILATHPGEDGLVRVVSLKMNGKITKRPITKICRLPFNEQSNEETPPMKTTPTTVLGTQSSSAKRPAAEPIQSSQTKKPYKNKPLNLSSVATVLLTGLMCFSYYTASTRPEIQPLNGGLFIEHIGHANLIRGSLQLNVILPLKDLDVDKENVHHVITDTRFMCTKGEEITKEIHCRDLIDHLKELQEEVSQRINVIQITHSRTKRGLLGRVLTSVFGVNDEVIADVSSLAENQSKLREVVQNQGRIVLQATKTLSATSGRVSRQLTRFKEQVEKGLTLLNGLKSWYVATDHNKVNIQFLATYQRALNFILEVKNKYDTILFAINTRSGLWECIKQAELETKIEAVRGMLSPHLEVMQTLDSSVSLNYTSESIQIQGHIPIVDNRKFELISATAVPRKIGQNLFTAFVIGNNILGINYNDQVYFHTKESEILTASKVSTNEYLLTVSTLFDLRNRPNCIIQELYNSQSLGSCSFHEFQLHELVWKKVMARNTWMFVTPNPVPAQTVCSGSRHDIILNGTGIIHLPQQCTLESKGYILTAQQTSKMEDIKFYIAPKLPGTSTITAAKIKHLNHSSIIQPSETFGSLVKAEEDVLHTFHTTKWKQLKTHVTAVGISTFSLCAISMSILVAVYMYKCRPGTSQLPNKTDPSSSTWYDEHSV